MFSLLKFMNFINNNHLIFPTSLCAYYKNVALKIFSTYCKFNKKKKEI